MKRTVLQLCLSGAVLLLALDAGAQAIVQIASDDTVAYFVKSDGSLWRGDNACKMSKFGELIKQANQEQKGRLPSSETQAQLNEIGDHLTPAYFTPEDLIVSNGVTAVAMQKGGFFFHQGRWQLMGHGEQRFRIIRQRHLRHPGPSD